VSSLPNATTAVEECLANIAAHNDTHKIAITVMADEALRLAKRCDDAARRGEWLGVLHGMPVALKDNIDTAGVRTTAGSKFFFDRVPDTNAPVVDKILAAGGIPILKANMAEFAMGGTSQNAHHGACRNPWDVTRIPGGSSGGSGAAVAAGMSVGALGTDTSGSVRIPGTINGVVGMRPTLGRVSNRGTVPVSDAFDTVGPLAYSAIDTARLLAATQGFDPHDPTSANRRGDDVLNGLTDGINGLKIGVPRGFFFENLHPDVAVATETALDVLEGLGVELVEVSIDNADEAPEQYRTLLHADVATYHRERLENQPELFGEDVYDRIMLGYHTTALDYVAAQTFKHAWISQFDRLFDTVDLIVTPASPVLTPSAEGADMLATTKEVARFTMPLSLALLPSLSVPSGFDRDGMPVGIQLAAKPWDDALLLRAAVAYQSVTGFHTQRPAILG
jgi:aspartyl-tRNA(Asn)/glutamyl-tRNA(Gln) amidotransferase subunit A